jgi:hypothetical protein
MTLPSTTGTLPSSIPTSSLILGDNLANLQAAWITPSNQHQHQYISSVQSRASATPSGSVPTTFSTSAMDASIASAAGLRFAMTGSSSDLSKTVSILLNAALPEGTFITQPEVLTSYLSAYDFIRGASETDLLPATRSTIEARLADLATGLGYGNQTLSNARAKIGATKGLAGVLLRNQTLLDSGLDDLSQHLSYSTTDDGWFTDSQGHYLNYTLKHVALFTRAYQQGSGVDLYPSFQPYVDMSLGLRMPDGYMPNVSNGLNTPVAISLFSGTTDATSAANQLWYLDHLAPTPYPWDLTNVLNNDYQYSSFYALTDFAGATPSAPHTSPTFLTEGQSQVSVFRQDWGPTSDYLLLSPSIDSPNLVIDSDNPPIHLDIPAFHTHNDTGEILLAARGQYILVAPGYNRTDLTNSPLGFAPQAPNWHNVVLVDGDLGTNSQGRKMRPEDFVHTQRLDSTELGIFAGVSDFATLRTNYHDTDISRSIAFPGENYFVVADHMQSDSSHVYGFNLVGRGTQTVLRDTPGAVDVRWVYNGAQVIEHLVSTHEMTLATSSIWMHDTFDVFEQTQRMTARMTAQNGLFLSVLETGGAGDASRLDITKLSSGTDWLAIRVESEDLGWIDTVMTQLGHDARTAGSLSSDGEYAYTREESGLLARAMVADATSLSYDNALIFESDHALTMSLLFGGTDLLGTVSADGLAAGTLLKFFDRGRIASATLNGVSLTWLNTSGFAGVYLPGAGELSIHFTPVPEPGTWCLALVGLAGLSLTACRPTRRRK